MRRDTTLEGLGALAPAFDPRNGTVTAGTSSQIADGAAAMIVMSVDARRGLRRAAAREDPVMAVAGVGSVDHGLRPGSATHKALARCGLAMKDIEAVELNEAFAAQALPVLKDLRAARRHGRQGQPARGRDRAASFRVRSGARITGTLINVMERRDLTLGLATMCIGMGQGDRDGTGAGLMPGQRQGCIATTESAGRGCVSARRSAESWLLLASYGSVAVALILIVVKAAAWLYTGSASLLGSLIDSFMDSMASLLSWLRCAIR